MLLLLAILGFPSDASGLPTPPSLKSVTNAVIGIGYPLREPRAVGIRLLVSPNGRVATCTVTQPSGIELFDKHACFVPQTYFRFKPGLDVLGQPTYAIYETRIIYVPTDRGTLSDAEGGGLTMDAQAKKAGVLPPAFNMVLNLRTLPASLSPDPVLDIVVTVDATGAIEQCSPLPSAAGAILGSTACGEVKKSWSGKAFQEEHGKPVRTLLPLRVKFVVQN